MITLLIARHGNTFDKGDTVLRVGKNTDLPLSTSGQQQAKNLGRYLKQHHPTIDRVIVSQLQRTQQTATLALGEMNLVHELEIRSMFDEIDYGVDEGQPETKVIARIGEQALKDWETSAIVPNGWQVNVDEIIQSWKTLAKNLLASYEKPTTILIVTSNGIARFAPYITHDFTSFSKQYDIKMKTGALSCFQFEENTWQVKYWNKRESLPTM